MKPTCKVIRSGELPLSRWSGGTTTQLAIYPTHASYAERDFIWRVSSATVDVPESDFTPLPGLHRILMVLDGKLELRHEGRHNVSLGKFGQDRFEGEWTTRSIGRATDFNLMFRKGEGAVDVVRIPPDGSVAEKMSTNDFSRLSVVFYLLSDSEIEIDAGDGQRLTLRKGDVMTATFCAADADDTLTPGFRAKNLSAEEATLIKASVRHSE